MRRLFWLVCLVLVIDTAFYAAMRAAAHLR